MTDRNDKRLSKRIAVVDEGSQSRDADLGRKLTELDSDVARTREVVGKNWNAIRDVRKEMDDVRQDVERLTGELLSGLATLNKSLRAMEQRNQEATRDIVAGIQSAEETSRSGLQHLATRFAMADALKVAVEADEIEREMTEALQDLEARRKNAELDIEAKRLAYDRAMATVRDGLEQKLSSVGAHVIALQDSLLQILDDLRPSDKESRDHEKARLEAQLATVAERDHLLEAALRSVDHAALTRLVSLRDSLDSFMEERTIEDLVPASDEGAIVPGFGVPFIAVVAPESDYNAEGRRMDVYGPGCEVEDCGDDPRPAPVPAELAKRIGRMCASLSVSSPGASPVTQEAVAALGQDVSHLAEVGVLTSEDALMVAAHLRAHPLYWLDS